MIIQRQSVRAILLTPEREVLLMRIRVPEGDGGFWITPGGGLEHGESAEDGLRRELREELGLTGFTVGPLVWKRQHTFNWRERRICQREEYRIVEVARFRPSEINEDAEEARDFERFHWWPLAYLAATEEELVPLSLPQIVARYLARGAPAEPLETEILFD